MTSAANETESTRDRILDVAESLFAQKGLAGTAVRDIARAAGLTAPSLYNYFEGKQALYEAVIARGVQPLFDLITGMGRTPGRADERSPERIADRTGEMLDGIMDHLATHPDLARLIQHEALTDGASLEKIAQGWLRPIVARGLLAMENESESVWTAEERPLAVAAWIHVILGHFAMAPLLRSLFDFDPLAPEQIERQKRFLRRYAQLLMSGADRRDDR
jgi:TetR/AcrR family transcriptional regulator